MAARPRVDVLDVADADPDTDADADPDSVADALAAGALVCALDTELDAVPDDVVLLVHAPMPMPTAAATQSATTVRRVWERVEQESLFITSIIPLIRPSACQYTSGEINVSTYGNLLRTRGVARLFVSQLTARLPAGMFSLSFMMLIEHRLHSYGIAGISIGAFSIGAAICGPFTSRWMGRWGIRRIVLSTSVVCATTVMLMALAPLPALGYIIACFIAGMSQPPVQSAVRTIYPKMVPATQLAPLYSLDATAQELIWVVGPVLATFLAFALSPAVGLALAAIILILGGWWFVSSPVVRIVRIPPAKRKFGKVLSNKMVLLAMLTSIMLIGSSGAVEAGVIAMWGDTSLNAGIILAIYSVGSVVGGVLLGSRPMRKFSLGIRLAIGAVGLAFCMTSTSPWWIGLMLFVSGLGFAPALAVIFALVSASVRFSETSEAYGWVGTGQLIGGAIGSATAGLAIDAWNPEAAFVLAAGFGIMATIIAFVSAPWTPDLTEVAGPRPDTAPIPTINDPH